jgi:hypothetical protein
MYEGLLCWVQENIPYFEEKNNSLLAYIGYYAASLMKK